MEVEELARGLQEVYREIRGDNSHSDSDSGSSDSEDLWIPLQSLRDSKVKKVRMSAPCASNWANQRHQVAVSERHNTGRFVSQLPVAGYGTLWSSCCYLSHTKFQCKQPLMLTFVTRWLSIA